jgi:phosphate:Na+ symporter
MSSSFDIGQLLAGIAIFMLGMTFMEESLRSLAGRKFKLILKKQTSNKLKAIGAGALFSALLQSSSIVNLLVLSLVGAGVIMMQNALAVMLGANLGTTFTSWIIATLGFNFNIDSFAFPLAGITGIALAFLSVEGRWYKWSRFLLGFSFLFIGLGFIKSGMMEAVRHIDMASFNHYPVIVFVIGGMLLTGVIQSSSATVAIALSALHINAISLYIAMAIVLGSEIGTTFKLFLASVKGIPVKKRVALGNFLFNTITVTVAFALLQPIHWLIADIIKLDNNLLALVFFQSFINVIGIALFYPLLNTMGRFLEKRFRDNDEETLFINKINVSDPVVALEAFEKETQSFCYHVLDFCLSASNIKRGLPFGLLHKDYYGKPVMEKYEHLKNMHGEIHGFYIRLQKTAFDSKESERPEQLISSVRNCMYAAKNMKDALHDIEQLHNSSNDTKYNYYLASQTRMEDFCLRAMSFIKQSPESNQLESLTAFYSEVQQGYTKSLNDLYKEGMERHLGESEISTLINFNRETYTAFKSILFALKDYVLNPQDAERFGELPGFIR